MDVPCKKCERKGCGSYHDKCEPYRKWKERRHKKPSYPAGRDYLKESTYKSRTHGALRCHMK